MGLFQANFKLIAERLLPSFKRQPNMLKWFGALTLPIQTLRNQIFDIYRPDVIERTKQNSQTLVLEGILNNTYNLEEPPFIYIQNNLSSAVDQLLLRKISEGLPPLFLRKETEVPDTPFYFRKEIETLTDFDFIVFVPSSIFGTIENRVRAQIEGLKLIGVNYDVQSY